MYDPKPLDMTDALMQVYEGNCGGYSKGGEKKLDAVGKEDKDIDNDGDHDKSDKYLLNRRKVRGAAIKTRKEEVEEFVDSLDEEQLEYVLEFIGGKKGDGYIGHPNLDIKNPLAKTQTKGPVGNQTGSGMVHRVGGALGDRKMKMDAMMKGLSKGGPVKKESVHVDMVANMLDEMTPGGRAREAVNYQRGGYHGDADFFKKNMDAIDTNLKKLSPYGVGGFPKARAQAKPKEEPKSKPTVQNAGYEPEGDMLSEKREAVVDVLSQLTEEQLNEILGGLVGGLQNMGKKGGFMKGASTGIGGLVGQAMGKPTTMKGLIGFSKGGEKRKCKKEECDLSDEEYALYESMFDLLQTGLFTESEIDHMIDEGYKEIDKKKENEMYRKAGNLARKSLSSDDPDEKEKARKKSAKIVSAIASQKENERFKKMGDEKARDNYGG